MSVTIRLSQIGKKNAPTFRVVASTTKDKRNGKYLELLGFYNPIDKNAKLTIDTEKYDAWVAKGAQVTAAVKTLLTGKYTYVKYDPKAAKAAAEKEKESEKAAKE